MQLSPPHIINPRGAAEAIQTSGAGRIGRHRGRRSPAGSGMTAVETEAALEAAVAEYTAAFNAMDKRTGFIETVEREENYTVLEELLQRAQSRLSAAGVPIDTAKLFDALDRMRDF